MRESRKKRPRDQSRGECGQFLPKQLRYLNFNAATVTGCRLVLGGEDVVERG
jgi:hypothetical protein